MGRGRVMTVIFLSALDLAIAASLVLLLGLAAYLSKLKITGQLYIAAFRTTTQLFLVGFILKALFESPHPIWVFATSLVMLLAAGREVGSRQKRSLAGRWNFLTGTTAMFFSSFTITSFALIVIIQNKVWYEPQYAIPLLGMILGNTMTGISLGLDQLTNSAFNEKAKIEGQLACGLTSKQAIRSIQVGSIRTGMIPIINSMAAAGLVSLPGMMTGQILSGTNPVEAVKYQILIMFLIASGTGLGTLLAVLIGSKRLFDERDRLRLDRLAAPKS